MADLFQTNPESIEALLIDIENGKLALPEFQRDFIWEPEHTARLLSSIIARYPAGSLLTWRPKTVELEPRPIADAPAIPGQPGLPERLVLDGQQRLTALYRALRAKTEESYFLAVDELIDSKSYELKAPENVNWDVAVVAKELTAAERRGLKNKKRVEPEHWALKWQHERFRFPLASNFDDWMTDLVESAPSEEGKRHRREVLRAVRDTYLSQLNGYRFPVVTLTDEASLAAVCTVFEKLNTNTVKLGPFEILTAKFFKSGVRLRKLWDDARAEHSVLRDPGEDNDHSGFSIDPYLILQIITLVVYKSPQQKAVLDNLTAQDVEEQWSTVVLSLKRAIEWLRDNCGVIHRDLLPYQAILVPITGAWLVRESMSGPDKAKALEKISRYFWASVFTTNFDQGGASQAERDYRDLVAWLGDKKIDGEPILPEAIGELRITADSLLSATVKKKALLKGVMALTVQAGAKDFHKGQPLTPQIYVEEKVNSHHLYPRARLADTDTDTKLDPGGYSPELVLNRALIDAETNRRIGARKPSRYIKDIREAEADVEALLDSHLIDTEALEADDYASFLRVRLDALISTIQQLTGTTVVPLTVAEGEADDQPAVPEGAADSSQAS
jgi:hypothetical protein